MIRAEPTAALRRAAGSRSSFRPRLWHAGRDQADRGVPAPDRVATEVVRHLNTGDLDGFRTVVAPTVRLQAAGTSATLSAGELFARLSTLAPSETLCAARVRGDAASARVDLEVAWPVPSGDVAESSLGTLELECAAGRVTGLALDLDVDPAVARGAAALRARPLRRAAALGSASRSAGLDTSARPPGRDLAPPASTGTAT